LIPLADALNYVWCGIPNELGMTRPLSETWVNWPSANGFEKDCREEDHDHVRHH
jgi:hypothetical protein